jgi:hypothetical protein
MKKSEYSEPQAFGLASPVLDLAWNEFAPNTMG